MQQIMPGFTRYPNRSGRSGVVAYKLVRGGLQIQFVSGPPYEYTAAISGAEHVEAMRRLAEQGSGLATYVNRHHPKFRRLD
jgi:hypothetical protein